jgi:hypothetical protein
MKPATSSVNEDRQKQIAFVVFGLIVAGVLYYELRDPAPTPAPPAAPVIVTAPTAGTPRPTSTTPAAGPAAKTVATTAARLDPTLHEEAMHVTEAVLYEGTGRNIFSAVSAPVVVIPKPIAPVRTTTVVAPPPVYHDPGPPPPPPIDLKFFGTATSAGGKRVAFLLHGEDVLRAAPGEIVARRYRILAVNPRTIDVEDMANNNRQTLPLTPN